MKKTIKAWAVMYAEGNILRPATLPRIWVQKTKPKVFKDGVELLIVPIIITYATPVKKKQK